MEALNLYLQQFPHYTSQIFEDVLPFLRKRELHPGELFLQEGRVCREVALVEKGLLRLYYLNEGKEITNCFCKENTLAASYSSFLTQQASDISIEAVETTQLIVLPYEGLQKMYDKHLFWQQMGRMAAEKEFVVNENHSRFIRDLSATERYLQILEQEKDLLQRVPLNYLAAYLQIAPETLSRIRKKIGQT
ncbi:MAG: Crp/Fnr family transcriptional regulator [Bacteroidota bacterium]